MVTTLTLEWSTDICVAYCPFDCLFICVVCLLGDVGAKMLSMKKIDIKWQPSCVKRKTGIGEGRYTLDFSTRWFKNPLRKCKKIFKKYIQMNDKKYEWLNKEGKKPCSSTWDAHACSLYLPPPLSLSLLFSLWIYISLYLRILIHASDWPSCSV